MARPPLLQRPVYLDGAPPSERVVEVCQKAAPFAGLLGSAILGAVAAYFVPKAIEAGLEAYRGRQLVDDVSGEPVELEVDT